MKKLFLVCENKHNQNSTLVLINTKWSFKGKKKKKLPGKPGGPISPFSPVNPLSPTAPGAPGRPSYPFVPLKRTLAFIIICKNYK